MFLKLFLLLGLTGCSDVVRDAVEVFGRAAKQADYVYVSQSDLCLRHVIEGDLDRGSALIEPVAAETCYGKPALVIKGSVGSKAVDVADFVIKEGEVVLYFEKADLCQRFHVSIEDKVHEFAWEKLAKCPEDAHKVNLGLAKAIALKNIKEFALSLADTMLASKLIKVVE